MVVPHSGGYPHAKFEGNLLLFKFGPHTKSGLTIPQCGRAISSVHLSDLRSLSYLLDKQATEEVKHSSIGQMTLLHKKEMLM